MASLFSIFKIKKEERWPFGIALLYVVAWNVLVISKYADIFMKPDEHYYKLFVRHFHISGFDPVTYIVVSNWGTNYNIYRHPLLAFFMYIPNQINQGLMALTGVNCVQFIVGILLVFCGVYSFIFLCRIFREIVGIHKLDAWLLGGLTYTFAYVMVSVSVPDHFSLSMFMLILTLYVAGKKMKARNPFTKWQTILFFFLTAGISLNNGIKVFLANLFVNGKKFWKPANLFLAIIIPSALIWGGACLEWNHFERPNFVERQNKIAAKVKQQNDKITQAFKDTTSVRDTAAVTADIRNLVMQQAKERKEKNAKKPWNSHVGKPMAKGEFAQWTDITTPRWATIVENLFGESIQLHKDYLLQDDLSTRPVIVTYHYIASYIIEGLVVLLFLSGLVCGWKSRYLWLAMSFFFFDMFIHIVLGFGINEVYIMSAHWLFILSVAMAYLFKTLENKKWIVPVRMLTLVIALYLLAWNGILYSSYLLG